MVKIFASKDFLVMVNNKICIIGSGAAAYFSVRHLIENIGIHHSQIDIITTGSIESAEKLYENQELNAFTSDKKMTGIIPEKLLFGSDKIYSHHQYIKLDTHFLKYNPKVTSHFGGLTHVWGANLSLLSDSDLNASAELIPLTRYDEGLYADFHASGHTTNGRSSRTAKLIYRSNFSNDVGFNNKITNLQKVNLDDDFKISFSNLALNISAGVSGCVYCGECLFGCKKGSIWSSAEAFKKLRKKYTINIIEKSRVAKIVKHAEKVNVNYIRDGEKHTSSYSRVFLGPGVLDTLDILANSDMLPKTTNLHDSTKYYTIFFTIKKSDPEFEKNNITLSELTYQYNTPYGTIHSQIYPSTMILDDLLKKTRVPHWARKIICTHFKFGMVYLPEGYSDRASIRKSKEKYAISNFNSTFKLKLQRLIYLVMHYFKSLVRFIPLQYIKIPFYYRAPLLNSQHFGNVRDENNVHINDFLPDNIQSIDSAALRYITGIPTTLLIAANAKCVIDRVFNNEK